MKITFLIGNGFDVGLGLKSKFKDFFPTYVKWSEHKSAKIKQLSLKIGEDFETWADFELQMGQYTNEFEPSEICLTFTLPRKNDRKPEPRIWQRFSETEEKPFIALDPSICGSAPDRRSPFGGIFGSITIPKPVGTPWSLPAGFTIWTIRTQ